MLGKRATDDVSELGGGQAADGFGVESELVELLGRLLHVTSPLEGDVRRNRDQDMALRAMAISEGSDHRTSTAEIDSLVSARMSVRGVTPTFRELGFAGCCTTSIGHGVDTRPHAEPQIPGFGDAARGSRLREGAILSLNVIAHAGAFPCGVKDDAWTVVATDGRRSLHVGQMVIVGNDAAEVITAERPW